MTCVDSHVTNTTDHVTNSPQVMWLRVYSLEVM